MGVEVKEYPQESLSDELTSAALQFRTDTNNIFDPKSCINEEDGKFTFPKGIKKAYLVSILDKRKLQKFELDSTVIHEDLIYGAWKTKDKTERKKWSITSNTTSIDLLSNGGKEFFMAACASRFVYGSPNAYPNPYFRIEIPELRAAVELEDIDNIQEALNYVTDLTESQLDDLSLVLNLNGFIAKPVKEKKAFIRKLAIEKANVIVSAKNNKDSATVVKIKRAIDEKVITQTNGVYKFADYNLGVTIEQVVTFFGQNEEIAEIVTSSLNEKAKKTKKA